MFSRPISLRMIQQAHTGCRPSRWAEPWQISASLLQFLTNISILRRLGAIGAIPSGLIINIRVLIGKGRGFRSVAAMAKGSLSDLSAQPSCRKIGRDFCALSPFHPIMLDALCSLCLNRRYMNPVLRRKTAMASKPLLRQSRKCDMCADLKAASQEPIAVLAGLWRVILVAAT